MKQILLIMLACVAFSGQAQESTKHQKLNELIALMNMDSMMDSMYQQMGSIFKNMSKDIDIDEDDRPWLEEYHRKMVAIMREEMSWAKFQPIIVDIYANNFTEQEIDDMIAFYKTPTGQSLLAKMPVVMQQTMMSSQEVMKSALPRIQAIAQELAEAIKAKHQQG